MTTSLTPLMPAVLPTTPDPVFPIRLIALDIDGTIIGDDHEIADRTVAAVRGAMERDVAVSLVTGRMVSSAMRFATRASTTRMWPRSSPVSGTGSAIPRTSSYPTVAS